MPNHSFREDEMVDEMIWRCLHHRKEKLSRFHRTMELASRGPPQRRTARYKPVCVMSQPMK